jgi:fucose 4-O-acetylase-like acetyltransferase
MLWSVAAGFALVFSAYYFSNLPYSIYAKSNFWTDSPALILIRVGISLLIMAAAYVWTEYCARPRWSWVQTLGKTSLMVYWVHVMLVYGSILKPIKRALDIPQTTLVTLAVVAAMVGLSAAKLSWAERRAQRRLAAAAAATTCRA